MSLDDSNFIVLYKQSRSPAVSTPHCLILPSIPSIRVETASNSHPILIRAVLLAVIDRENGPRSLLTQPSAALFCADIPTCELFLGFDAV